MLASAFLSRSRVEHRQRTSKDTAKRDIRLFRIREGCASSIPVPPGIAGPFPSLASSAQWQMILQPENRSRPMVGLDVMEDLARHANSAESHDFALSLFSRPVPESKPTGDRRAYPAPAARNLCPGAAKARTRAHRSPLLGRTPPALASLERAPGHRQTEHGCPLAWQELPTLLATHLEAPGSPEKPGRFSRTTSRPSVANGVLAEYGEARERI